MSVVQKNNGETEVSAKIIKAILYSNADAMKVSLSQKR